MYLRNRDAEHVSQDVAAKMGIDPIAFRRKNLMPKGYTDPFSKNELYYDTFIPGLVLVCAEFLFISDFCHGFIQALVKGVNVKVDAYTVFTNKPAAGAMRGYGIPQAMWAVEPS